MAENERELAPPKEVVSFLSVASRLPAAKLWRLLKAVRSATKS